MKKFILIFLLSFAAMAYEFKQGRLILSDSDTIENEDKALLELNSTTRGLLIPRLTSSQVTAMGTVPKGLLIYNSETDTLLVSNGTTFISAGGGGSLGDLQVVGNTLESVNANADINISPNGTGKVFVDTSLQVDSITIDGVGISSTGTLSLFADGGSTVNIESLKFDGFTIFGSNGGSNIRLSPTGGGILDIQSADTRINGGWLQIYPPTGEVGRIRIQEPATTGSNYVQIAAVADITDNQNLILPGTKPTATGEVLQVASIDTPNAGDVTLSWATPAGGSGDTTRIQDGDNNTYVDTDEAADIVRLAAGSRTIDFTGQDLELKGVQGDAIDRVNIKFFEPDSNGTNSVALRAPLIMSNDYQITLPSAAPTAIGQVISVNTIGGGTDAVLEWATPAGGSGDTTRIQDGDGDTFVETDLNANSVDIVSNSGGTVESSMRWAFGGELLLRGRKGINSTALIRIYEGENYGQTEYIGIRGPNADVTTSYSLSLPATTPGSNQILESDSGGNLSWINTPTGGGADADAIHDNVAGEIAAITEKTVPVGTDLLIIEDSADSNNKKKVQIGNLPGGGVDTTRITDGGAVWVDTDEVTDQVIMNVGLTGGARAIWSKTNGGQFALRPSSGGTSPTIAFQEPDGLQNNVIKLGAPQADVTEYSIQLPAAPPGANQILQSDATADAIAILSWVDPPAGGGDTTRIQDGDGDTYLDVDLIANTIYGIAGNNGAFTWANRILSLGGSSTLGSAQLRIQENPGSPGADYIGISVPADVAADYNLILPSAVPTSGQVLSVNNVGVGDPVDVTLEWASAGGGGDSTRINDGADTTFVDTDATANAITWNAENGTADATCSATFDGAGFFDKNDFQFATCNSHIIRFTGTATENATLRITDNGSGNTSPRFYFDVAQGSKWFIIRPPDAGGAFNNSELILPNDPPTAVGQVLAVKTVVDTDTHETEWVTPAGGGADSMCRGIIDNTGAITTSTCTGTFTGVAAGTLTGGLQTLTITRTDGGTNPLTCMGSINGDNGFVRWVGNDSADVTNNNLECKFHFTSATQNLLNPPGYNFIIYSNN